MRDGGKNGRWGGAESGEAGRRRKFLCARGRPLFSKTPLSPLKRNMTCIKVCCVYAWWPHCLACLTGIWHLSPLSLFASHCMSLSCLSLSLLSSSCSCSAHLSQLSLSLTGFKKKIIMQHGIGIFALFLAFSKWREVEWILELSLALALFGWRRPAASGGEGRRKKQNSKNKQKLKQPSIALRTARQDEVGTSPLISHLYLFYLLLIIITPHAGGTVLLSPHLSILIP